MELFRINALAGLGLALATAGRAQDLRDAGILRLYSAGTEIGRETFVRTPDYLETETVIPVLAVRVKSRASYRGGRFTAYEARVFRLPQDSMLQDYRARVDGDSIRVEHTAGGQTRTWVVGARVDAVAASQSLAALGDLVRRAAGRDTTLQLWSAEQNAALAVTLRHGGDSVLIETLGGVTITRLAPGGTPRAFEIPTQRVRVERAASLDLPPLAGLSRPATDYSAPPEAPYTAQDVRIPVRPAQGDSFELAGTLTLPKAGRPPFPIAIMITGSGAQDRDENLWPLAPSYRPFRDIAARFALDRQVTAGQADTLAAAMRASGNRDVMVHIFPRLNHLFLVAPTDGSPAEYAAIEDTGLSAEVLDPLASWLAARLHAR